MKVNSILLSVALLLAGGATAWADVSQPMVKYVSTDPGVTMTIYNPFATGGETYKVGMINLEVDLPDGDPAFNARSFCIDLKQYSSDQWKPYNLESLEAAPKDNGSAYEAMGPAKALAITELWSEQFTDTLTDNEAAAFQVAIWEIIYEDQATNGWDLDTGVLNISDATVAAIADGWLAQVDGNINAVIPVSLVALTNVTTDNQWQDYAYNQLTEKPPVPEPVTMITLAMGISGLGMYVRRRTVA